MRPRYHRTKGALKRVAATVVASAAGMLGVLAPPCAGAAASQAAKPGRAPGRTLVIEGAGDGHGVGMSQWGALGFAGHGWSAARILRHYYAGTTLGHVSSRRIVKVLVGAHVKKVPIEAYVRGVVAAEMPPSWPAAALEAQAIASRTYALTDDAGGGRFDVYADTRSQVYLGKAAETPASNAAVKATAGKIVEYAGEPAITLFFASSGGMTEDVQNVFSGALAEPWLTAVVDPYDGGPLHRWNASVGFARAARQLHGLVKGGFDGIEVLKRGISPRVLSADVLGTKGRTEVSGAELAERLGLYSTWAYFAVRAGNGRVKREPDLSGTPPPSEPPSPQSSEPPSPPSGEGAPETSPPEAAPSGGAGSPVGATSGVSGGAPVRSTSGVSGGSPPGSTSGAAAGAPVRSTSGASGGSSAP